MKWFIDLCRDDAGATMVEYGIMIALVAAVCIGAVTTIGTSINTAFGQLVTAIGRLIALHHCPRMPIAGTSGIKPEA